MSESGRAAPPRRRPVVATAPWTRGPLLLLRQPMAAVAVVAAAAVLGLVVAAGPLFVSSVGTAALHTAAAAQCAQDDQISVINQAMKPFVVRSAGPQDAASVTAADPPVRAAFARAGLPAPVLTRYATVATTTGRDGIPAAVGLFATAGALEHVRVLSRVPGSGVFVPDTYAARRGLRAGDSVPVAAGALRIAGIYRDLDDAGYRTVLPAFWCHWRDRIVRSVSSQPPPLVLADATDLGVAAAGSEVQAEWTAPVDVAGLTVAEADDVAAAGRRLFSAEQLDPGNRSSAVAGYAVRTTLDFDLGQTARLQGAVGAPVLSIAAAGAVLALVLVGGSVLFWAQRRRDELALLAARGIGPGALGFKAVLELALPSAAGCAVGWAGGLLLVPLLGPSPLTEPGAAGRALLFAAAAWVGCLAVVLAVAAAALGEHRHRSRRHLRYAPVALVAALVGGAWVLFRGGGLDVVLPGVHRVAPALLLAPVLGLAGLVLAGALVAAAPLPRARAAVRGRGFPLFAAVNRAAAARGALVVVLCGLAVPTGLAVYGAGFTASSQAAVTAKAHTYLGAPVVLGLHTRAVPDVGGAATPVSYALGEATGPGGGATEVEVLGVDPCSLGRYAYADREVTGTPLPDLLRPLAGRCTPHFSYGERPAAEPAILVGAGDVGAPTAVEVGATPLPVSVAARAPAFPGMRYAYHPVLVVDIAAVAGLSPYGWQNELWTDQAHLGAVMAALSRQDVLTDDVQQPASFLDATSLLPVTWTFSFLRAVSVAVAGVSAAGLLLFLSARQQRQEAAYLLLRRMGMGRRAYLRSLLVELGGLTGWAWLLGALTGVLALLVATRGIDLDPGFLPPSLLRLPRATLLGSGLGLAAVAVALAAWTQRRADRASPSAVLRG